MTEEMNWQNVREYMRQREQEEAVRRRDEQKGAMRSRAAYLKRSSIMQQQQEY